LVDSYNGNGRNGDIDGREEKQSEERNGAISGDQMMFGVLSVKLGNEYL
jgi:hypothetical protein